MTENLPVNNNSSNEKNENGRQDGGRFLAINHLHYHANELSELRKLAEVDISLAEKVIEQRESESRRVTGSYNFGLVCTVVLLGMVLFSIVGLLIVLGVIETLVAIVAIFALALLVRVILTGEWSDTSWFGKVINLILRSLGGKPSTDE